MRRRIIEVQLEQDGFAFPRLSPIHRLPNELILQILDLVPASDRVSTLRTSSSLHDLGARSLYTNVRVDGVAARRLFATLATKSPHAVVYSGFLRRLRYTFTSASESYLTYPVFCQALLTLDRLVSLSLDIFPSHASSLWAVMQRYGLLKTRNLQGSRLLSAFKGQPSFPMECGLPSLRALRVRGMPTGVALACHRGVEELVLSTPLEYEELDQICRFIDSGLCGHRIVTLVVRIVAGIDTQGVLVALAEVMPNLEQLSFDQLQLDPKSIIWTVAGPRRLLPSLRRLSLNVLSSWKASLPADPEELCQWLGDNVDRESQLVGISIGMLLWFVDLASYTWTVTPRQGRMPRKVPAHERFVFGVGSRPQAVKSFPSSLITYFPNGFSHSTRSPEFVYSKTSTDVKGRCEFDLYFTVKRIAAGASGTVWKAFDQKTGHFVAVKIGHQAVQDSDQVDRVAAVSEMLDKANFAGTNCLVYALGGASLDRVLGNRYLMPLPRMQVREIIWQLANAVAYIKPANVILETLLDVSIKLIDLDDIVQVGYNRRNIIGTSPYRAPEVTIGECCVWSKPVDIFSLGCLAAELFMGVSLFQPYRTHEERLASLERVLGVGAIGYGSLVAERPEFFTADCPPRVLFTAGRAALRRLRALVPLQVMLVSLLRFRRRGRLRSVDELCRSGWAHFS
ncbi:kinase-like domain-containing protein [Mycena metata]|uniref:Kinase-like domain-containing protein n=1 Tax=Mycena metata TaxID=1033252 RepID=A0AAD7HP41_9AGAR|nr:kinase-like domain-containing protein [Mycena metata]